MKISTSWLAYASLGAFISPFGYSHPVNDGQVDDGYLARRADDFYLRIMPLGASITYGISSSDGNGYRKALRDQLRYDGWRVNMVGSLFGGSMNDSDTEGWSGYRVEQVLDRAKAAVPNMKPNLVLINAGTNDAGQNYQVDTVGKRMRELIEYLLTDDPDRVVVLSTLVANAHNQARTDIVNTQYRDLVKAMRSEGKHVVLADLATSFITLDDISSDGTHPTDAGYRKLAAVWHKSILEVEKLNWLKSPKAAFYKDDDAGSTTCEKTLWSGVSRGSKEILRGAAGVFQDDGKYVHKSELKGVIATGELGNDDGVWFAELVGDGEGRGSERDEFIWTEKGAVYMRVNEGNGTFGSAVKIDTKSNCDAKGIRWGDVNNDGLDDFICINEAGDMNVSVNRGGNPPKFEALGVYTTAPSGGAYNRSSVRLGDIDGDGRLDYCVVASSGDVTCWRNAGQGDKADSWQDLGSGKPVFTDKGLGSVDGIVFADLNGDSRSDYLWLDENGKVTTCINQRGPGKGLIPNWDESGVTHLGMNEPSRSKIRFGRVFGTGRTDYNYVKCASETDGICKYEIRAFKNLGSGGAHQKGDGGSFCDMDGNGNDDYIWASDDGKITIFRNTNTPPTTDYGWDEKTEILSTGVERRALRFADMDGDGRCDVVAVTKDTGALDVWYTSYDKSSKKFSFSSKTRIDGSGTSKGPSCGQGWGVGITNIGLRLADIDGDGRADYLCIEPNGRVTGSLNTATGFKPQSQIKLSEGRDRADLRFADVNGNGLADLLVVDKFTGDTSVWLNKGPKQVAGSSFEWERKGVLYQGSGRGENVLFANLGGQGRADMVNMEPKTDKATAWFNPCPRGGDDGKIVDPKLPEVPEE